MNYKQVIDDFRSGIIDRNQWTLLFDNDCGYWSYNGDEQDVRKIEALEEEMTVKYGRPSGYNDLVDLAEASGIHAGWC